MDNIQTNEQRHQKNLERLRDFSLLDDTFARTFFRQHPDLAEFVLRIMTGIDDLSIDPSDYETQYDAKRIAGSRSVIMDIYGGDTTGRKYNLEMENWDADPERGEYHVATMCMENLEPQQDFKELPEIYVIFVCGRDAVGNGRAINHFSYRNDDIDVEDRKKQHDSMRGKTHILYVNCQYDDKDTDLGKLIHDFRCRKASEMYYSNLAERTRYLKENPKGVKEMCKIMEDAAREERQEERIIIAQNLLNLGLITHEQIAKATSLTLEEVKQLAGQAAS